MELAVLKTEIEKQEYKGLADQAIADLINAMTVEKTVMIPTWRIKQHAIERGYWSTIQLCIDSPDTPLQVKGLAIAARDWIDDVSGKITSLDTQRQAVGQFITGLVQSTLLSQDDADDLVALATETVPWTTANGLPEIGPGYIESARRS